MSQNWPMVPLGEMLARSETVVNIVPTEQYREITIRLWGKGVVLRGEVQGQEITATRRFGVRAGQFILSRIDARNGALGIVPDALDGAVVSNDFPAYNIVGTRLFTPFLGWISKTRQFVDLCRAASEGTTNRVRLQEQRFLQMAIPLPPLPEQRRIVAKVEELAAKIEEARGLRGKVAEASDILWKAGASLAIRGLPGECWQPLSEIVEIAGGGTPSKDNPAFWNGTIPWVSPKDMKKREITHSEDRITEAGLNGSSAKLHPPGVVLIVIRGMILAHTFPSAVLRVPATINQDMKALYSRDGLLPEYLCSVLWALNDDVLEMVDRSSHDTRKLVTPKLKGFHIPVPSLPEQRRIVAYLDDLQAKVDAMKALQANSAAELDALLPSVLDKAFKGAL